jgi:hypothetical protein
MDQLVLIEFNLLIMIKVIGCLYKKTFLAMIYHLHLMLMVMLTQLLKL